MPRPPLLGGSSLQRERLDAAAALLLTACERLNVASVAFLGALQDLRAAEVLLGELGDPGDGSVAMMPESSRQSGQRQPLRSPP